MTKSPSPFEPGNPYYRPPETTPQADPLRPPEAEAHSWRVPWTVQDAAWGLLVPIFFYALTFLARRILGEATPGTVTPPPTGSGARLLAGFLVIVFQLTLLLPVGWALRKYGV